MKCSALTLLCCVLLAACAAPAPPPEPAPPVSLQAPSAAAAALPVATTAAAPTAPRATPLPRGKRLREVWPQPLPGTRHVTALLYSSVAPSADERRSRTNVFWRVNLNDVNNRQKIAEIVSDQGLDAPFFGQLSPDGVFIAYINPTGDYLGDLYIIGSNGSNNEFVSSRIARTGGICHRSFVWSSDGQQLAIIQNPVKDELYGNVISVYDLRSNSIVSSTKVGWAFLIGWQEPQTLLAITSSAQGQPRILDAIDPTSTQRQAVATFPSLGFYCSNPSPDRQKILLDLDTGSYVFNTNAKVFQKMTAIASAAVWNPDSATVLDTGYDAQGDGRVSKVTQNPLSTESVALRDVAPSVRQGLLSASPDGRYLAMCEARELAPDGLRYRTMLYDIVNDRWKSLAEEQGCVQVLGWQ